MNRADMMGGVRVVQAKYPFLILTGSALLLILELMKEREAHDLDFAVSDSGPSSPEWKRSWYKDQVRGRITFYTLMPTSNVPLVNCKVHVLCDHAAKEYKGQLNFGMRMQEPAQAISYKVDAGREKDLADLYLPNQPVDESEFPPPPSV